MKWDYKKTPPEAWYVEDGDWIPVDPKLVLQCNFCKKWYVDDPINHNDFCSTGCKLNNMEKINSDSSSY